MLAFTYGNIYDSSIDNETGQKMTIKQIQRNMAAALLANGVSAEITFCRADMFSVLVDDGSQFEKAKDVMARVSNAKLDSEDRDEECGNIAYYTF